MNPTWDDEMLDDAIRRAVHLAPAQFDVNRWMREHPQEVRLVESWRTHPPGATGSGQQRSFFRRHAVKLSLAAAAAIVIAIVSTLSFDGQPAPGVAWANVAAQLRNARTARVSRTIRPHPDSERDMSVDTFLWKAPDMSRTEQLKPGKTVTICNGNRKLTLDPEHKTYSLERTTSPQGSLDWLFAFAAVPASNGGSSATQVTAEVEGQGIELIPDGVQQRDGRELRKYRMRLPEQASAPGETKYAWFGAKTGKLAMFTSEMAAGGQAREAAVVTVELDVELSDDLFSTAPPAGYKQTKAASRPGTAASQRVSAADRPQVFNDYMKARSQIDRYRLVVWSKTDDGNVWPAGRSMRDDNHYRTDAFISFRRSTRDLYNAEIGALQFDHARPWQDPAAMDAVWRVLNRDLIQATTMNFKGTLASIQSYIRMPRKNGNRFSGTVSIGPDPNADQYSLPSLGWPMHFWREEHLTDGKPHYLYKSLPPRPDRPGLVGIRVEIDPASPLRTDAKQLYVYWLDPTKDFLCVVYEYYQYPDQPWSGNTDWRPLDPVGTRPAEQEGSRRGVTGPWHGDHVRRIIEFGRTPTGRWYPLAVQVDDYRFVDGKRYGPAFRQLMHVQIDFDRSVPSELLEWPAGVPEP